MHLSKLFVTRLFFIAVGMLLIVISCDSPPSGTEAEPGTPLAGQFFAYSDSTNPLLTIAVDTLQERNAKDNFINGFCKRTRVSGLG